MTISAVQGDISKQRQEGEEASLSAKKEQIAMTAMEKLGQVFHKLGMFDPKLTSASHKLAEVRTDFFSGPLMVTCSYLDPKVGPKVANISVDIDHNVLTIDAEQLQQKLSTIPTYENFGSVDVKRIPVDISRYVVIKSNDEAGKEKIALYHPTLDVIGEIPSEILDKAQSPSEESQVEAEEEIKKMTRAFLETDGCSPVYAGEMQLTIQKIGEFKRVTASNDISKTRVPDWMKGLLEEDPLKIQANQQSKLSDKDKATLASRQQTFASRSEEKLQIDGREIAAKIENRLYDTLRKAGFASPSFYKNADMFLQTAPVGYDGTVVVYASAYDEKADQRQLPITVQVNMSTPSIPTVPALVEMFASTKGKNAEALEKYAKEQLMKLDDHVKNAEMEEKVFNEIMATLQEGVKKEGSVEVKAEEGTGAASDSTSMVPQTNLAESIEIDKVDLPDSLEIGNEIDVNGIKYVVESEHADQNSQRGTGSKWVLRMSARPEAKKEPQVSYTASQNNKGIAKKSEDVSIPEGTEAHEKKEVTEIKKLDNDLNKAESEVKKLEEMHPNEMTEEEKKKKEEEERKKKEGLPV